jgi:hypothetical protein
MHMKSGISALLTMVLAANTLHAETCGIDTIFAWGFEIPSGAIDLDNAPGALQSPGFAVSISGPSTFSIDISYPTSAASIADTSTVVTGTFSGPTNTGIVINDVTAYVTGNRFLAFGVPVETNNVTLTATASKMTGETTSTSVNITQGTPSPLTLTAGRSVGFAPMRVVFIYDIGNLPGKIQYVGLDYTADGIDDVVNPAAGATLA